MKEPNLSSVDDDGDDGDDSRDSDAPDAAKETDCTVNVNDDKRLR